MSTAVVGVVSNDELVAGDQTRHKNFYQYVKEQYRPHITWAKKYWQSAFTQNKRKSGLNLGVSIWFNTAG